MHACKQTNRTDARHVSQVHGAYRKHGWLEEIHSPVLQRVSKQQAHVASAGLTLFLGTMPLIAVGGT